MAPPFQGFYFDCDSTLSSIEGVDELTARLSAADREHLWALTEQAMEGHAPLAGIYEERLARVAPTAAELVRIGELYVERLVPDAARTIAALQSLGKHVGIVSGGLRQPVAHLAAHLGIPDANVHAVAVLSHPDGTYRDFDRQSPLWRNGGKIEVLQAVPASHRPLMFVGDGVTDLEAKDVVDQFVGYGGVARRERVATEADAFLEGPSLASVLAIGLTDDEKNALAADHRFGDLLPIL